MARTEIRGSQILDASVDLSVDTTGTLPVAKGGTGSTTLANGAVLLGAGTGALGNVSPGTVNTVLKSNGTQWVSGVMVSDENTTAESPSASAGTSTLASRSDHQHPFPTYTRATGLPGATASCHWVGGTTGGSPTTVTWAVGDWVVTKDGFIFVCITAGTPGTWRRIPALTAGTTPHALANAAFIGNSTFAARADHVHPWPKPRVSTLAGGTSYTPNVDTTNVASFDPPTGDFTVAVPAGTPADEQRLELRIRNGGTGFKPLWDPIYISSGVATLPTTAQPANKVTRYGFMYDSAKAKYVLYAADNAGH